MQKPRIVLLALAAAMCMMLGANISVAADQAQAQEKTQSTAQKPDVIYGSQLMTSEERAEFRARMRSLKTKEERDALRMEHHQKMQERAQAMGKTLPDMPAAAQGAGGCAEMHAKMHGGMQGMKGMQGGMKCMQGGAAGQGAACGCCGGAGGCCAGMKPGAATPEGAAAPESSTQGDAAASGGHVH